MVCLAQVNQRIDGQLLVTRGPGLNLQTALRQRQSGNSNVRFHRNLRTKNFTEMRGVDEEEE